MRDRVEEILHTQNHPDVRWLAAALRAAEQERDAALAQVEVMREALDGIATFAWSAFRADCTEAAEEGNKRINACKAALATPPSSLIAEREAMRNVCEAAIKRDVEHSTGCGWRGFRRPPYNCCSCGSDALTAALDALRPTNTEKPKTGETE